MGSWARGDARFDSDVDLMLLTTKAGGYVEDGSWAGELGGLRIVKTRSWGPTTERRFVLPSGLEVEIGVAPPSWAATGPIDDGTRAVVQDGLAIAYDPDGLLAELSDACRRARGKRQGHSPT